MNTNDVDYKQQGFFALLKGPSGAGKTVGALSFPEVWMGDYDRKMPAIARKHFPKKSIEFETFDDCFMLAEKLTDWANNDNCPYETLLHDSITSLVSLVIKSIAAAKGESTPQLLRTIQKTKSGKGIPELMGIDYYNAEARYIEWFIDINKVLWLKHQTNPSSKPRNILFTAHILTVESSPDIKTKIVTKTRSIVTYGKKPAAYIPTQFDENWLFGTCQGDYDNMGNAKVKHLMTTETTGEDDAKTAFKLPQIIDFTDASLYDQLKASIAGSEMFL